MSSLGRRWAEQPHGTLAAVRRHYRLEGPGWRCRSCRQAETRRWQDYQPVRQARRRQQREAA